MVTLLEDADVNVSRRMHSLLENVRQEWRYHSESGGYECRLAGNCSPVGPRERHVMKTSIFSVGLLFILASFVYSQNATPVPSSSQKELSPAQKKLQYLTRQLNLTEAQQQQIGAILEKSQREIEATKLNHGPRPHERMVRIDEIIQETYERVETQLTPEQQQDYEQIITGKWKGRSDKGTAPAQAQPAQAQPAQAQPAQAQPAQAQPAQEQAEPIQH